ncbi:MAG TPA: periplasmic heavy metal sensor [Gemmatimonadaceae bacterium]|jgi:Spy/CpxP family protein refolding chaperone|nr:periplasmic heavy metal sensor [Gemmatimonadaceae bacterium]
MRVSILALAFVLSAATLSAQGAPPGQRAPGPPGPGGPDDFGRNFFPPELVMQHQGEIGLQDAQRAALTSAVQQAQGKFMDVQWKLSAEGEKMGRLLQPAQVDETQVLEEVDRILALEREMKRTQIGLMVRIKNTLTPAQQAKLTEIRGRTE